MCLTSDEEYGVRARYNWNHGSVVRSKDGSHAGIASLQKCEFDLADVLDHLPKSTNQLTRKTAENENSCINPCRRNLDCRSRICWSHGRASHVHERMYRNVIRNGAVRGVCGEKLRVSVQGIASPVAMKYRKPNNAAQQWSGRGRQPASITEWIAMGKSLDQTRI